MGRPVKKPTDEQRKQIQTLAGFGLTQEQIARVMGIDRKTLAKHCGEDYARGKDVAMTQAVQALFHNIKKGKEASIFFYLKTQHGWRETPKTEQQGEASGNKGPPPITINVLPKPEEKK